MKRIVLNERSYHGRGAVSALGDELRNIGAINVLFVCDKALDRLGTSRMVTKSFEKLGINYKLFSDFKQNPTVENVNAGVSVCKRVCADCIVVLGGGSAIDTAKAIAVLTANPDIEDLCMLEGDTGSKNRCLPVIAIPSTAGTAAEVTINYVITDEKRKKKLVCVDPNDIPVTAIVDPDIMASMPASLAAATGMDALTHAIEGYVTAGAWEMSDMFHLEAIRLISHNLEAAVKHDQEAQDRMALGQYIAGMGFSNVGLGLVHAMAHPLGAVYDIPHGVANAVLLSHVLAFNIPAISEERFEKMARAMGVEYDISCKTAVVEHIKELAKKIGIPADFHGTIKEDDIDFLVNSALNDPCFGGNPRKASYDDIAGIYRYLMEQRG